jgi:oxygen-independent coproporphyrinogen-3 oxidase
LPERWADLVERNDFGWIESTPLTPAQEADEMLLMGLRLAEGIDLDRLAALADARPSDSTVAELEHDGLIEKVAAPPRTFEPAWPDEIKACVGPGMRSTGSRPRSYHRIRATKRGRFVLNEIVLRLALSCEPPEHASAMDIRTGAD